MSKSRASIFEDPTDPDISGFAPKTQADDTAPSPEEVRAVAEAVNFHSREPVRAVPIVSTRRRARTYRTGRNVQVGVKVTREVADRFYALAESQGWILGYTFERAVEALRRELESHTDPSVPRLPEIGIEAGSAD